MSGLLGLAYRVVAREGSGSHLSLSPGFDLIRRLRSVGAHFGRPDAGRLGTQSVGSGAARTRMSEGGATSAQLLRACQWHGRAVRFYLDLNEGERRVTTEILIRGSDDEPLQG